MRHVEVDKIRIITKDKDYKCSFCCFLHRITCSPVLFFVSPRSELAAVRPPCAPALIDDLIWERTWHTLCQFFRALQQAVHVKHWWSGWAGLTKNWVKSTDSVFGLEMSRVILSQFAIFSSVPLNYTAPSHNKRHRTEKKQPLLSHAGKFRCNRSSR